MKLRPGSFGWLAAHDLRQSWRAFDAAIGGLTRGKAILLAVTALAIHVGFWWGLRHEGPDGLLADDTVLSRYLEFGVLFILPGIVAQAMTATTRALYAHGDLEMLFASPLSARAILGARAIAIAANAIAWFAILLLPLADVNVFNGHIHWLALYPALVDCGLFGTGVGIVLALAFFVIAGPRRARLVAQIAATFVGASFVLGVQIYAMLPAAVHAALAAAMLRPVASGWLDWRAAAALPARAATGDCVALVLWTLVSVAVFAASAFSLGQRFAAAAVISTGAPAATRREGKAHAFRASLGATLRSKERRIVLRDPWLISQMFMQIVYMLPISLVLWRNGGSTSAPGVAFTPLIVVVGAQLAGSLAWLALSGEDAPDLLRAAPIAAAQIERHKLQAILAPIALLLAAPVAALAWFSPWGGLCAALFAAGAGVSTALLNLWRQAPARRGLMLRRHAQSKIVGLIEHVLAIVWTVGAVMAVMGHWGVSLVPVVLACLILGLSRPGAGRVTLPAGG
ncbi:MAG: hypothetical protein ABSG83_15700 [Roseiarcus sp.]